MLSKAVTNHAAHLIYGYDMYPSVAGRAKQSGRVERIADILCSPRSQPSFGNFVLQKTGSKTFLILQYSQKNYKTSKPNHISTFTKMAFYIHKRQMAVTPILSKAEVI